jgi:hypothetical protein
MKIYDIQQYTGFEMVEGKTASKILFLQNIFLREHGCHEVAPVGRRRLGST